MPRAPLSDLRVFAGRGRLRVGTSLHICVPLIKIKGRRQTNGSTNQLFITATIISSMYSLTSLILCVWGGRDVRSQTSSRCDSQQFSRRVRVTVDIGPLTLAAGRLRVSDYGYD